MDTEPLDDDYRMPLNPKPHYCPQCDNEVGEDETLCRGCREDAEEIAARLALARQRMVRPLPDNSNNING